jgi:hypothetical protein
VAGDGDEVTETKTRADAHHPIVEERPTEVEQPGLPLAVDTEPGEPPEVVEDELPWITEPAVEPESDSGTEQPPDSEPPEKTQVIDEPEPPPPRKRSLPIPRRRGKHVSDMRARLGSMPPAPLDISAYVASLRQAGASEEDITKLLEGLGIDPATLTP